MYEFETINDDNNFVELQHLWENLCLKSNLNIYSNWDWIFTWWKNFGSNKKINIVLIKKNNEIIGIIPLMLSSYNILFKINKLEFIGVPDTDFNGFLIEEKNNDVITYLIDYIKNNHNYDLIAFKDMSEINLFSKKLIEIAEKEKINFRKTSQCPYMYLPDKFETFYKDIKKSLRKNIRYRSNKLQKEGEVKYVDYTYFSSLDTAMEYLFSLHIKRYSDKNESGYFSEDRKKFHKDLAKKLDKKDQLHFGFLLVNEDPVAVEYSFTYRDTVYAYQSGFDPDYNKFGVGRLCEFNHIKSAIEKKMKIYSWTRGFESYIADWTDQSNFNMEFRIYGNNLKSYFLKTIDKNRDSLGNLIEKIPLISKDMFRTV